MLDRAAVRLCAQCLAEAAAHECGEDDLALTAIALARDLADTHRADAAALFHAASLVAAAQLDASEPDHGSLATAQRRLRAISFRVEARLDDGVGRAGSRRQARQAVRR